MRGDVIEKVMRSSKVMLGGIRHVGGELEDSSEDRQI
jgi:hypothetical protein